MKNNKFYYDQADKIVKSKDVSCWRVTVTKFSLFFKFDISRDNAVKMKSDD